MISCCSPPPNGGFRRSLLGRDSSLVAAPRAAALRRLFGLGEMLEEDVPETLLETCCMRRWLLAFVLLFAFRIPGAAPLLECDRPCLLRGVVLMELAFRLPRCLILLVALPSSAMFRALLSLLSPSSSSSALLMLPSAPPPWSWPAEALSSLLKSRITRLRSRPISDFLGALVV